MSLEPPRVLVIEDAQSIIDVIHGMLSPYGIEVASCDTLTEARRLVVGALGVICDVHLAGINGINVAHALLREGFTGPVVMISGDNRRRTVEEAIRAGVDAYLVKPFSQEQLLKKLLPHLVGTGKAPQQLRPRIGMAS